MLNPYLTVCLYLGMRTQKQWLKSNEFIRVGPWSHIASVLIRRDTIESSLSLSPLLSLFLLRTLSLSLIFFSFSLSMWGLTKKLAISKPGRDLSGGLCHPFCLQNWEKTNVSCLFKLPSLGLCNGSPRWQRQYVSTSSNKLLGNHMGARRRFRGK